MVIELNPSERELLKKVLDTYLSELRHAVAATKRDTSGLHAEEDMIKGLQRKVAAAA